MADTAVLALRQHAAPRKRSTASAPAPPRASPSASADTLHAGDEPAADRDPAIAPGHDSDAERRPLTPAFATLPRLRTESAPPVDDYPALTGKPPARDARSEADMLTADRSPTASESDFSVHSLPADDHNELRRARPPRSPATASLSDLRRTKEITVAPRDRKEFNRRFARIADSGEELRGAYSCAFLKEILLQGKAYLTESRLCFHANIFGFVTKVDIPWGEVRDLQKTMTAFCVPNAIVVITDKNKYFFGSVMLRDDAFEQMEVLWKKRLTQLGLPIPTRHLFDLGNDSAELIAAVSAASPMLARNEKFDNGAARSPVADPSSPLLSKRDQRNDPSLFVRCVAAVSGSLGRVSRAGESLFASEEALMALVVLLSLVLMASTTVTVVKLGRVVVGIEEVMRGVGV